MANIILLAELLLCGVVLSHNIHYDIAVDEQWLESTVLQKFNTIRHHATGIENKRAAKEFIVDHFKNLSLTVILDEFAFETEDEKVDGTNIIGIYPGINLKDGNDLIYMVGAYYDTVSTEDVWRDGFRYIYKNGAGVTAMLEAARILVNYGKKENTLVFVALDLHFNFKDDGKTPYDPCCKGARRFVNEWLPNYLEKRRSSGSPADFGGSIILESVWNYNEDHNSQFVDFGGSYGTLLFPTLIEAVERNGYKGDFMALVSSTADSLLPQRFKDIWNQFHVTFDDYILHHAELSVVLAYDAVYDFIEDRIIKSDSSIFFRNNYKSILVTDTGTYRNLPELDAISSAALSMWLSKTVKTVILTLETLSFGSLANGIMTQISSKKSSVDVVVSSPGVSGCPKEFYDYAQEYDLYYKVYNRIMDRTVWSEAKARCEAEGAQLMKVFNSEMLKYNYEKFSVYRSDNNAALWVGLSDIEEEGKWRWLDGSNVTDELWGTCQPDNSGIGEDCGALYSKLIDLNCDSILLGYMCACNDDIRLNNELHEECFVGGYTFLSESKVFYKIYQSDSEYRIRDEAERLCQDANTTLFSMKGLYEYSLMHEFYTEFARKEYFIAATQEMFDKFNKINIHVNFKSTDNYSDSCVTLVRDNGKHSLSYRNCYMMLPFICARFCEESPYTDVSFLRPLEDHKSIVFSTETSIKIARIISDFDLSIETEIATGEMAYSFDFLYQGQGINIKLFWHSRSSTNIMMVSLEETVNMVNVTKTDDVFTYLSVDWLTKKIYWSCMELESISVTDIGTQKTKTLFFTNVDKPSQIKVDPEHGVMYWIESKGIKAASMDGKENAVEVIIRGSFTQLLVTSGHIMVLENNFIKMYPYHKLAIEVSQVVQEMDYRSLFCLDFGIKVDEFYASDMRFYGGFFLKHGTFLFCAREHSSGWMIEYDINVMEYFYNPRFMRRPSIYFDDKKHKSEQCLRTTRGIGYFGNVSTTSSGYLCQRWDSQEPHKHSFGYIGDQENYCRNPNNETKPWCYTTDPYKRWEVCNIPYCEYKEDKECLRTARGKNYFGHVSTTSTGYLCQRWDSQEPHKHSLGYLADQENYCRNPDYKLKPWCYTMNPGKRWELCNIPYCEHKEDKECLRTALGINYFGHVSTTSSGYLCQRWDSQEPHKHSRGYLADQENYCRNPNRELKPWCYTMNPDKRRELCNIPYCEHKEEKECLRTALGIDYFGHVSTTSSGYLCQRWDSQEPHEHSSGYLADQENYCRNLGGKPKPWCYTMNPDTPWELCSIPYCEHKAEECLRTARGIDYFGHVSTTSSGYLCQRWDSQEPHKHSFGYLAEQENYCRNPDNETKPWCYTMNPDKLWELCNIPYCEHKYEECLRTARGIDYFGHVSTTSSGYLCQRWDSYEPHSHYFGYLADQENYCRNPDHKLKPWCYTMNPNKRWEFCNIPYCEYHPCRTEVCSYVCLRAFGGSFSCVCPLEGIFKTPKNGSCDYDNCEANNGGCQHFCHTTKAYPYTYCDCFDGFNLLFDGKTCMKENEAVEMLLFTDGITITQLTPQIASDNWRQIHIEHFGTYEEGGIDYDPINQHIYWVQRQGRLVYIKRAYINGTGVEELLSSLFEPGFITLDIVQQKAYLSVQLNSSIETMTMGGDSHAVLHRLKGNCFSTTLVIDGFHG